MNFATFDHKQLRNSQMSIVYDQNQVSVSGTETKVQFRYLYQSRNFFFQNQNFFFFFFRMSSHFLEEW